MLCRFWDLTTAIKKHIVIWVFYSSSINRFYSKSDKSSPINLPEILVMTTFTLLKGEKERDRGVVKF